MLFSLISAAAVLAAPLAPAAAPVLNVHPFALSDVTLLKDSALETKRAANSDWLLHLEPASLTCLYTSAANLTCRETGKPDEDGPYMCKPGTKLPKCTPYGHPRYYGHYLGHYLSATAMAYAATGDAAMKVRLALLLLVLLLLLLLLELELELSCWSPELLELLLQEVELLLLPLLLTPLVSQARGDLIVKTLAECQVAHGKNSKETVGFVYPYDLRSFQVYIRIPPSSSRRVC